MKWGKAENKSNSPTEASPMPHEDRIKKAKVFAFCKKMKAAVDNCETQLKEFNARVEQIPLQTIAEHEGRIESFRTQFAAQAEQIARIAKKIAATSLAKNRKGLDLIAELKKLGAPMMEEGEVVVTEEDLESLQTEFKAAVKQMTDPQLARLQADITSIHEDQLYTELQNAKDADLNYLKLESLEEYDMASNARLATA
jgi:hypothetical protein